MDTSVKISIVVAVLAIGVAAGAFAISLQNSNQSNVSSDTAQIGDKVSVDYIGTFYFGYDEEGAELFDTSIKDIGLGDSVAKSIDFTPRAESAYTPFSFTVGTGVIEGFNKAVIGMKVGETRTIYIEKEDAYNYPTYDGTCPKSASANRVSSVSLESFKASHPTYDFDTCPDLWSSSGWPISVSVSDDTVILTDNPEMGKTYTQFRDGDTKLDYVITAIDDDSFKFNIEIVNPIYLSDGSIKMVKVPGSTPFYITNIEENGYHGHVGRETFNMPLYFTITLRSLEKNGN